MCIHTNKAHAHAHISEIITTTQSRQSAHGVTRLHARTDLPPTPILYCRSSMCRVFDAIVSCCKQKVQCRRFVGSSGIHVWDRVPVHHSRFATHRQVARIALVSVWRRERERVFVCVWKQLVPVRLCVTVLVPVRMFT